MEDRLEEIDVVALKCDLPEEGLVRGDKGTIVSVLAPGIFLVEFLHENSPITKALPQLREDQVELVWKQGIEE